MQLRCTAGSISILQTGPRGPLTRRILIGLVLLFAAFAVSVTGIQPDLCETHNAVTFSGCWQCGQCSKHLWKPGQQAREQRIAATERKILIPPSSTPLCSSRHQLQAETLPASYCAVCRVAEKGASGLHLQCPCCYSLCCTLKPGCRNDSAKKGAPRLLRKCKASCCQCWRAVGSLRHLPSRVQCNAVAPLVLHSSGDVREDQIASRSAVRI